MTVPRSWILPPDSGIDAFHIARKAASVTAVEQEPVIAEALRHNARVLGLDNISVVNDDCKNFLALSDTTYDTMFIDPARRARQANVSTALPTVRPT